MKSIISAVLALVAVIAVTSCNENKDTPVPVTQCTAGSGGNVTIVNYALHNGDTLLNYDSHPDTAFVKYSATTSPGTSPSNYDTYFVSEGGEDHIHIKGLKCGTYFIYRTAFDSVSNKRYTGSMSINFTQTSGEIDTAINVN